MFGWVEWVIGNMIVYPEQILWFIVFTVTVVIIKRRLNERIRNHKRNKEQSFDARQRGEQEIEQSKPEDFDNQRSIDIVYVPSTSVIGTVSR